MDIITFFILSLACLVSTYSAASDQQAKKPFTVADDVAFTSAQIGDLVAGLRDRVAEASQNNRRNRQYPEIPQVS